MEYALQCFAGFLSVWSQDVAPQAQRLSCRIPSYSKPMPKIQIKAFTSRLEDVCESFWSVRKTLHSGSGSRPHRLVKEKEPDWRMYLLEAFVYGATFLLKSKL